MGGPACKVVINGGIGALSQSLERILTDPNLNGGKIPEEMRLRLIQDFADLDNCTYDGKGRGSACSLIGIMEELESVGVLTSDVWRVYNKGGGKKKE